MIEIIIKSLVTILALLGSIALILCVVLLIKLAWEELFPRKRKIKPIKPDDVICEYACDKLIDASKKWRIREDD